MAPKGCGCLHKCRFSGVSKVESRSFRWSWSCAKASTHRLCSQLIPFSSQVLINLGQLESQIGFDRGVENRCESFAQLVHAQ
jgi:hypothetical protein